MNGRSTVQHGPLMTSRRCSLFLLGVAVLAAFLQPCSSNGNVSATAVYLSPVHGWDVYYAWGMPLGATSKSKWHTDVAMEVTLDPGNETYYYFSHFTFFSDKKPAAGATLKKEPGAYVGLQTNGNHRTIVFSVWNGVSGIPDKSPAGVIFNNLTNATTSHCKPFGEEMAGYHCFRVFNWLPNKKYKLRMELASRNAWGDAIRGSMLLPETNEEIFIGEIFVPAFLGSPVSSVLFYEYFGSVLNCSTIPSASMVFSGLSLTLKTGAKSIAAAWTSISSMLNGAGGGACIGWADMDICNTTVAGSSPVATPLTQAKPNRCRPGTQSSDLGPHRQVPTCAWEVQPQMTGPWSRLPRLATWH